MGRLFFPIAIALCVGLVVACASTKKSPEDKQKQAFDDFRAQVARVVEDPGREEQAIELVTELQKSFFDVNDAVSASVKEFRTLNADYDASREDMQMLLDQLLTRVQSEQRDVFNAYRQLRKLLTKEEWDAIDRSKSKALSAAITDTRTK